ncbi:MAG: hypothetical protein ACTSVE_02555, partial [Candidatus Helarchaeota archaeon]
NKITFQGTSPTAESKTLNINLEINITSTISGVLNGTFDAKQGNEFNITYTYNNTRTLPNQGIDNATIITSINGTSLARVSNNSEALLNSSVYHLFDLNNGFYNLELNLTYGYNYTLNISTTFIKPNFSNSTINFLFNSIVNATNVTFSVSNLQVIWGNSLSFNVTYWDEHQNSKIQNSSLSIEADNDDLNPIIVRESDGVFNVTIDSSNKIAGNRTLKFICSKNGYETNNTIKILRIIASKSILLASNTSLIYEMDVNSTIYNFRVSYNDVATGNPITNASAQFFLYNASHERISIESHFFMVFNDSNGNYWFNFNSTGLHEGTYHINYTLEEHNGSAAWERNQTVYNIKINKLISFLNVSTELFRPMENISWYQNELITIYANFSANSSSFSVNPVVNVSWGTLTYELRNSTFGFIQSGSFNHVEGCFYSFEINLSMKISNPLGTKFYLILNGSAQDIQNSSLVLNLTVAAKRNASITISKINYQISGFLVEGTNINFQFLVTDNDTGAPIDSEILICKMHIVDKTGFQYEFRVEVNVVNGQASFTYRIPYNLKSLTFTFEIKRSLQMWNSGLIVQSLNFYPPTVYPLIFLLYTWYIFVIAGVSSFAIYRFKFKYKPKKEMKKGIRDTISYRFKSAANLVHLLMYDQKTMEVLYTYSIPGVKLSSYTINSILESVSMYDNMKVVNQEVYLRDDARLIMHDGEYTRIVMITKELPSVEMRKQMEQFLQGFELKFGKNIPQWRKDLSRLARMIDMKFADELIEKSFEVSLTFQHTTRNTKPEIVKLTLLENKMLEIAKQIESKSGPFYLQRLVGRAQLEIGTKYQLLLILEAVYNLRKQGYLKPLTEKDAERLREQIYRDHEKKAREDQRVFKKKQRNKDSNKKFIPFTN